MSWTNNPEAPPHRAVEELVKTAQTLGYNIREVTLVYYDYPDEYLIQVKNKDFEYEAVNKIGR